MYRFKVAPIDADYSGQLLHAYKEKKDQKNHPDKTDPLEKPLNKKNVIPPNSNPAIVN